MKCPVVNCRNIQVGELTVSEVFGESMARVARSTGLGCELDVRCTDEKLVSVMITPKPAVSSDPRKGPHAVVILHEGVVEEVWNEPDQDCAYERVVEAYDRLKVVERRASISDTLAVIQQIVDWEFALMPTNRPCKVLAVPVGAA